jgi:hypothetical protein
MKSPDESFEDLLREWRVEPRRDPGFRAAVRQRIEAVTVSANWTNYVRGHAMAVAGAIVLAVVLGAWGGREQAREHVAAERAALVADYVRALDARWMRER